MGNRHLRLRLAYPLVLGRRGAPHREPYFAAVLASVPFFFFARDSLIQGGFEGVIGILPVTQAALLAVLLICLLRIQPPGERDLGRLVLVAGAGELVLAACGKHYAEESILRHPHCSSGDPSVHGRPPAETN